ncbi:MAG: diguanylate cyclase [Terriglobales bacterium]
MDSQLEVLLIEDDAAAAGLCVARLHARLKHVDCLAAALHALSRQRFDAVLVDLQLPDASGLEAVAALRGTAPAVPVVVLTGNQDAGMAVTAVQQGAQDYLTKDQIEQYPPLLARSLRYAVERQRILMIAAQVDELKERERQLTKLNEMGELLQVSVSAEEAYQIIVCTGAALFSHAAEVGGELGVLGPADSVEIVASWGNVGCGAESFSRHDCWALRRGRAHVHRGVPIGADLSASSGMICRHRHPDTAPGLCVPLMAQGELLGVVCLADCGDIPAGAAKLHKLLPLAITFSEHIALALCNLRLREKLREQAIRDPLTGLLNRRYMEETLARELSRAQRSKESLGVLMVDLDAFKLYNDRHGHAAGDRLLAELGRFLNSHTRGGDIACRYGGDEFVLILPSAGLDAVQERARQIRQGLRLLLAQSPVSASIGAVAYPHHGGTPATLLAAADAAMYAAKNSGRELLRSAAA